LTKEELISKINTYVRNSAVDSYTNDRLNSILLALAGGASNEVFQTYTDFRAAYQADTTKSLKGFIISDDVYFNNEVVYEFIPEVGVMLGGLELIEPIP